MLRAVLLASVLFLATVAVAPPASAAAPGESCTFSLWRWAASVNCNGVLYESVVLTWCPRLDDVSCLDRHVLTCTVSTTTARPIICPISALA